MTLSLVLTFLLLIAFGQAANFGIAPSSYAGVQAGATFNIVWSNAVGPVTLLLKNGEAAALKTVSTIASGLTGTSYSWSIPSTLPTGYYALEIDDNGGPNYSAQFLISGGLSLTSSTPSSTFAVKTSSTSSTPLPSSTSTSITPTSSTAASTTSSVPPQSSSTSSSSHSSSTSQTSPTGSSTSQAPSSTASSALTGTSTTPTSTPSSTSATKSGLSTGTKAAIGTGVTLGVLLVAGLGFLLFWFGKRSAKRKSNAAAADNNTPEKAELGAGTPLNDEEKAELQRRRRAAELDGANDAAPVEIAAGTQRSERAELEARRKVTKEMYEMS